MEGLIDQFHSIVKDFRLKRHDLLAYHNNKFDRDYVEFNVKISDLECSLQASAFWPAFVKTRNQYCSGWFSDRDGENIRRRRRIVYNSRCPDTDRTFLHFDLWVSFPVIAGHMQ